MSEQKLRLAHIRLQQADVARQQGDLPAAIDGFTKAIELYKEIAQEDSAAWPLVADTIETVAATYKAAGELDKAKEAFVEAASLRERLVQLETQRHAAEAE